MTDVNKRLMVQFLREAFDRIGTAVLRRRWRFSTEGLRNGDEEWEEV
jgi:hypothetical protein